MSTIWVKLLWDLWFSKIWDCNSRRKFVLKTPSLQISQEYIFLPGCFFVLMTCFLKFSCKIKEEQLLPETPLYRMTSELGTYDILAGIIAVRTLVLLILGVRIFVSSKVVGTVERRRALAATVFWFAFAVTAENVSANNQKKKQNKKWNMHNMKLESNYAIVVALVAARGSYIEWRGAISDRLAQIAGPGYLIL